MSSTKAISSFQHDQSDMFSAKEDTATAESTSALFLDSHILSPSRGSFAKHCLVSVVSKMGIEIEVEYYKKEKGIMTKIDSMIVIARDATLKEMFGEISSLSELFKASLKDGDDGDDSIHCYAGDVEGKEISMDLRPKDVDYVITAMRSNCRPTLILCKGSLKEERRTSGLEESCLVGYTGRTASGMVKEMLNPHGGAKIHPPTSPSVSDSTVSDDSVFSPTERTYSSSDAGRRTPQFSWKGKDFYTCQEELARAITSEEEEEEEEEEEGTDEESSTSTSSRQSYKDLTTSNSSMSSVGTCNSEEGGGGGGGGGNTTPSRKKGNSVSPRNRNGMSVSVSAINIASPSKPRMRNFLRGVKEEKSIPDLYGTKKKKKSSDPGYFTLRPTKTKSKNQANNKNRFSMKPRLKATRSIEAEITPPSPLHVHGNEGGDHLIRHSATRRGKRVSRDFSQPSSTIPESSYSLEITKINIVFRNTRTEVPCREYNTIREMKEGIARELNKLDPDRCTLWRGVDFVVTYEKKGKTYELFNDWQFIYKTGLYQMWGEEGSQDSPVRVSLQSRGITDDLKVVYRISQLIGVAMDDRIASLPGADVKELRRVADSDRKEIAWTRRILHSFVEEVAAQRNSDRYSLSMELAASTTSTILALKIPVDSRIKIIFHYKQCFSLTKQVKVQQTADNILREIFPCLVACGLVENKLQLYTLQISGERSYIAGSHTLIEFKDIRRSIIKGEPVNLSIKMKPNVDEDVPCTLNWLTVDPFSGTPPLHTDITSTARHDSQVQALSLWDRDDDFTLRVDRVENLPVYSNNTPYSAIVEATLYHGDKPLCPPVTTAARGLDGTIHWRETINFKIAKKNIPRAAKILFIISEPSLQRRESVGVKKAPKYLYWGLTTVFDYQGIMFNGEHSMTLWKGKREKEEKKDGSADDAYLPNPSGPASNNSDSKAVILVIKFDSYGFTMHFPSCSPQSWATLLVQPNVANVAVRKQFQRLLEFIQEGKLHSAVPAYIQKVNWGSLAESLEVYSLLDQLADASEHFPVEIALKLLDCDFPDEGVRGFAIRVLEEEADEKLEDYLLQLTQALKFEPHHDSQLARFLLKRSLCNKRLGHFFLWYLKCEMVNPQYTTRFGVILEAYLTSCGEAMLRQFEHQVEMQTTLEKIGLELKQTCNDDQSKMQSLLPEVLERYRLPEFEITPVYNPRIRLGNLRPNKCKIMSSKKKPQWLEMSNVDETALSQTPTRLILKMGDDLRQDMITLRILSLFEKLWEEDGLDLALIPYGCIATGPNTGFIEVVKNAKTIAEVSGVNNQTKLLDWIKSNQKNEFGEVDSDMVKMAVKTFVHSCAGYSVATYVLGIGDRHNDNIMITTSGNIFHIDFGHFLGNIKYCMGFKREWAPFVLTPDFVYAMGGEDSSSFDAYKNLCCRAFLTLRRHAELIINLFSMMRSTGIPELTCVEDTDYIKNALALEKSEHEAEQMFRKVIKKCLDLKWTVQVMWKFHLLRKRGSS